MSRQVRAVVVVVLLIAANLKSEPAVADEKLDPAATQHYAVTRAVEAKGLFPAAARRWQAFITTYPKDPRLARAYHNLGACQLQANQFSAAAKTYRTLLKKFPKFDSRDAATFNLALSLYNQAAATKKPGDFQTAAKAFRDVSTKFPKSQHAATATYYRAESLYQTGDFKAAATAYALFVRTYPKSKLLPSVMYALGTVQQESGRFSEAAATYKRIASKFPKSQLADECRLREGMCLFQQGKYPNAEKIFAKLVRRKGFPFVDLALLQQAQCRHKSGKPQDALRFLNMLVARYPKSTYLAAANLEKGQCEFSLKRYDPAAVSFRAVIALKTAESPTAAYWLAKTHLSRKKPAEAVVVLTAAIAAYPKCDEFPLFHLTQADALFEQPAKRKQAAPLYVAFATKYPTHEMKPHALYMAGFAFLSVNDYPAAAKQTASFLADAKLGKHPLIPDVLFVAAESRLLAEKPNFAEAETLYTKLVTQHTRHRHVPRARIRLGYCRFRAKKYSAAIQQLTRAVPKLKQPELKAEAWLLIGRSQEESRQAAKALAAYQTALKAKPSWDRADEVLLRLAIILRGQQKSTAAKPYLTRLLSAFPKSVLRARALYELGQLAESQKQPDEALRRYRTVLSQHAKDDVAPAAAFGVGHVLFTKGTFKEAAQAFSDVLKRFANSEVAAQARYERGLAYHRLKQYPSAVLDLQAYLAGKPGKQQAHEARFAIALCQVGLKRTDSAVKTLLALLAARPDAALTGRTYYELGHAYLAQKKNKQAVSAFQQLVAKSPMHTNAAEAWYHIGRFHRNANQWQEATTAYSAGLKVAKQKSWREDLQHEIGYVHYRAGKYAEAVTAFQLQLKTFSKDKHIAAATYLTGECLFKQQKWKSALTYFAKSIQRKDADYTDRALYRSGACAARLKQWPQSGRFYKTLLANHPRFEQKLDALYGLGMAFQMQVKLADARKAYQQILNATKGKNTRTRSLALYMLGECDFREQKHENAIVRYVAAALYPDGELQAQCHYEIGRCFIELKRPKDALRSFDTLIKNHPKAAEAKLAVQLIEKLKKKK